MPPFFSRILQDPDVIDLLSGRLAAGSAEAGLSGCNPPQRPGPIGKPAPHVGKVNIASGLP
jgi:hypothetical protein